MRGASGLRVALLAGGLAACMDARAGDDTPSLEIGGLLFGDLYYIPSHHLESGEGASGVVARRGYLTFDARFGGGWFGRLRFETNQSGAFETYDFDSELKDLYLGHDFGRHRLLAGLSPTLTFDVVESAWGLRYLARTPMDLQGAPSRDTGLSLRGPLNASGSLGYRAMYSPAVEFGSDGRDGKKWMAALNWQPAPGWMLDFYTDHEAVDGPADRTTWQVFAAWAGERSRWGALYSNQDRQQDPPVELVSAYAVRELGDDRSLIARVDRLLEPSARGDGIAYLPMDPSAKATMFIGGLELRFGDHFTLTPNTVVIYYDRNDEGIRPTTDFHLRLTLFVNFE